MFEFKFYDKNVSLINKIMKFFLYYFNYLAVLNTWTQEFNLENSDIFWRLYYVDQSNESTITNKNSLIVMTDFTHHFFRRGITSLGSKLLKKKHVFIFVNNLRTVIARIFFFRKYRYFNSLLNDTHPIKISWSYY